MHTRRTGDNGSQARRTLTSSPPRDEWSNPQKSKDDFMNYHNHMHIPYNIRKNIWNALTVPKNDGSLVKENLMKVTTRLVTIEDLKAANAKASSTSVPGPPGLSYNDEVVDA